MDGKQRAKFAAFGRQQSSFHSTGIKIESGRINVGKNGRRPGSHDGAGGSQETERRGDDLVSRLHTCGNHGSPQNIGPRRPPHHSPSAPKPPPHPTHLSPPVPTTHHP